MKILVIALSGIGDALMFTPALNKLREAYPEADIDALVMFRGNEQLYENLPEIRKVHFINFLHQNPFKSLLQVLKLRGKYHKSINVYPSNRKEYNIISFLIGAKKRTAVRYLRSDIKEMGFLNNVTITENDDLHNVEENIKLIERLSKSRISEIPPLSFPLLETDKKYARLFLEKEDIEENTLVIGIHAGCATLKNHINRRWAPEKFTALAKRFIDKNNARVLIFGGPEESDLKNNILDRIASDSASSVDTCTLPESVAVMKRCNVFVTNDSALMHIAAANRLKTIAIIGPTNVNYIRPWQTEHTIVSLNLDCSPCFYYSPKPLTCTRKDVEYKCVRELEVDQVYNAVIDLLS